MTRFIPTTPPASNQSHPHPPASPSQRQPAQTPRQRGPEFSGFQAQWWRGVPDRPSFDCFEARWWPGEQFSLQDID